MRDRINLIEKSKQIHAESGNPEEILKFLRTEGCSKIESMDILIKVIGVTLAKAKEVVHTSETWSDVRVQHEKLHASLEKNLKDK